MSESGRLSPTALPRAEASEISSDLASMGGAAAVPASALVVDAAAAAVGASGVFSSVAAAARHPYRGP